MLVEMANTLVLILAYWGPSPFPWWLNEFTHSPRRSVNSSLCILTGILAEMRWNLQVVLTCSPWQQGCWTLFKNIYWPFALLWSVQLLRLIGNLRLCCVLFSLCSVIAAMPTHTCTHTYSGFQAPVWGSAGRDLSPILQLSPLWQWQVPLLCSCLPLHGIPLIPGTVSCGVSWPGGPGLRLCLEMHLLCFPLHLQLLN